MAVFLNPRDIRNLAGFLGTEAEELFRQGRLKLSRGQNGLILPRLRFGGRRPGFCPFSENQADPGGETGGPWRCLCRLHGGGESSEKSGKPLVCRLSPLARRVDFSRPRGRRPYTETWALVPPVEGCPGCSPAADSPLVKEYRLARLAPLREELAEEAAFFKAAKEGQEAGLPEEELFFELFGFKAAGISSPSCSFRKTRV
jgi:hypothetical protein